MTDPLLATVADLRDFLGDPSIALDDGRAVLLLEAASARIRSYTGQTITQVEDDEVVLAGSGRDSLLLPQLPVTEVSEVVVDDDDPLTLDEDFRWQSWGLLVRLGTCWPVVWSTLSTVTVTYTHGYAEVPADLRLACVQMAARMFTQPGLAGPLESETIGDYSYTVGSGGTSAAGLPLMEERSILDRYRLVGVA